MKNKIKELQGKLMLMGMSGLAYTPSWNKVAKELNKLEKEGVK